MENRKLEFEIDRKNLEFEINRIKQESLFVYDLLIRRYEILFDILPTKHTRRNISFPKRLLKVTEFLFSSACIILRFIIGGTYLEKILLVIFLIGMLMIPLFNYYRINELCIVLYAFILVIVSALFWFLKYYRVFKKKTHREEKLELVGRFLIRNKQRATDDLAVVHELCSIAHISTLDFVLAEIKNLIDEQQARAEVYISFLPILSLFSVAIVFKMLGISDLQAFISTLFLVQLQEFQGL
ncbi:MAG: hypothetical protein N4J56_006046 [Chroococcidiopsis sp. SAG 2025]|nr:hypothetical protein [Chroococcidiopsis sp. SAG 2025]